MKCFKGDISVDISLVVVSGERLAGPSTKYKLEPMFVWEGVEQASAVSGDWSVWSCEFNDWSQQSVWPCYLHCHLCLVCLLPHCLPCPGRNRFPTQQLTISGTTQTNSSSLWRLTFQIEIFHQHILRWSRSLSASYHNNWTNLMFSPLSNLF